MQLKTTTNYALPTAVRTMGSPRLLKKVIRYKCRWLVPQCDYTNWKSLSTYEVDVTNAICTHFYAKLQHDTLHYITLWIFNVA